MDFSICDNMVGFPKYSHIYACGYLVNVIIYLYSYTSAQLAIYVCYIRRCTYIYVATY